MKLHVRGSLALILFVLIAQTVFGQTSEANLSGTVTDTTGAVTSHATVKFTSKDQGTVRTVQTNSAGIYQFSFVPAGGYILEITANGFKNLTQPNVVLAAAQNARMDFKLEVGNVSENVTITATSETVNTESAELGAVVDNTHVTEMPLNARVFWALPLLVPGVAPPVQGSSNSTRGGINIAGSGEQANNFTINGMDNNDTSIASALFRPSIDAIQEFNVLTGVYSAQWGYGSGGQVIVTTKSGTNSFHGTAFDFLRNSAVLTARNFFQAPGPTPSFKRNQYGVTFGGPIQKNKTFFFYSYEGLSSRQAINQLDTVPTPAMQGGDFSSLLSVAKPVTIKNPVTGVPYAGNIIPQSQISPIGAALLRAYPNPSFATAAGALPANNFAFSKARPETDNINSLKLDHSFSANDLMYAMANFSTITADELVSVPSCHSVPLPGFDCPAYNRVEMYSLSETHILNASMVNEARIGFSLENTPAIPAEASRPFWNQFGIVPRTSMPGNLPFYGYPNTSITGFTSFNGSVFVRHDPRWQFTDAFSYTHGKHTIKTGFNLSHLATNNVSPLDTAGGVSFSASASAPTSGYSVADVLLGYPTSTSLTPSAYKNYIRAANISLYVQDDWKFNSRLTLNIGLRWEDNTPQVDVGNHETTFDPTTGRPLTEHQEYIGNTVWKNDLLDFAPRLGFAYQPFNDGKTVIRGGVGTFFNAFPLNNGTSGVFAGYPYTISNTYASSVAQPVVLSNPFPTANAVTSNNLSGAVYDFKNARVYEYTLGVQHQLKGNFLIEATYMGSLSNHLKLTRNINQPAPGPGTPAQVNARRPYPQWGTVTMYEWDGNAHYQSLQAKLTKRLSFGLSFILAYTYAHSIDDLNSQTSAYNLTTARGPSSFDVRHRVAFSPVYQLPFGKGRQYLTSGPVSYIVGGWQLSSLFQWQTGAPLTSTLSGAFSNTGSTSGDRPNVIGNPNANAPHTVAEWFNTAAFQVPTAPGTSAPLSAYSFGNEGVGVIISPGLVTVDFSLVREFQVREWARLQLRAEVFNAMNHANLGFPGLTANTATFGIISSALDPRLSQFALKLTF